MTIGVRDEDTVTAMRLADAVVEAAIAWDDRRARSAVEDLVASLTAQIQALDAQIVELRATPGVSEDQVLGRITGRAQQQEKLDYARALAGSVKGLIDVLQRADTHNSTVAPRPLCAVRLPKMARLTTKRPMAKGVR